MSASRDPRDEPTPPRRGDRVIRWGYWIVLALLAVGAGRTLWRLARMWGWV